MERPGGAAAAPANDTELHLTAWIAGAGFCAVMTKLMRSIPAFTGGVKRIEPSRHGRFFFPSLAGLPEPTSSPPVKVLESDSSLVSPLEAAVPARLRAPAVAGDSRTHRREI